MMPNPLAIFRVLKTQVLVGYNLLVESIGVSPSYG